MKKMKSLIFLTFVLSITGCVSSYKDVTPSFVANNKFEYTKDVNIKFEQNLVSYKSITLDAKIIPDKDYFIVGRINSNKEIYFRYLSRLVTTGTSSLTITQRDYYPENFTKIEELKIPAYITGRNVFDLNEKGNFAYISDKNIIKVITKLTFSTLSNLEKNRDYKDKNINTIKFSSNVKQISFQPNSNILIAVLDNNSIELWDYIKAKKIKNLTKTTDNIELMRISSNGEFLVLADNKSVYLWNLKTYKSELLLNKKINEIAISKDVLRLAFLDNEGNVLIYDIHSRKELQKFSHNHIDKAYGLSFNPKSNETVITAGLDGIIKTWDLNNTKFPILTDYNTYNKKKVCNANMIEKTYFSNKSDSLKTFESKYNPKMTDCNILGNKEQIIDFSNKNIFDSYRESLVETLVNKYKEIKKEWIYADLLNPYTGEVRDEFFDFMVKKNGKTFNEYKQGGHFKNIETIKTSYSQEDLDSFLNSKSIKPLYDKTVTKYIEEYKNLLLHMNAGAIFGIVSDGNYILPYGSGYQEKYSYYKYDKGAAASAVGVPDIRFDFARYTDDRVYKILERDVFQTSYSGYTEIIAIDDNKVIAVKENLIELWDYKNKNLISTIAENGTIYALDYDAKNKIVAVGLSNHKIKLWDIVNKKSLGEFVGHTENVLSLKFIKNGKYIVSGSADATAIIWDVSNHNIVKKLTEFERAVSQIEISPDEKMISLVSIGNINSEIMFYDMNNFSLINKLSPEIGMIKNTLFLPNTNRFIALSSGKINENGKNHKRLLIDSKKLTILDKSSFSSPFTFVTSMTLDDKNNQLYISGNDDEVIKLRTNNFTLLDEFDNLGNGDSKATSITTSDVTKDNRFVNGNKKGYLTIHK
ncbi:MAG: WD40 repeat domain-containing protein [Arcobacter sp.]|uniref:WD40 repeat domain-containing protein n=1 Tax=Arcobacter sp. TaxID=1872629 RepID=UPI0025907AED|nr:WD40 repeat domain-containing protein [Arcobacter sp.]MDD3009352.1 WD40 repeat domain-containing protein [Arcobacter sp.]